MCYNILIIILIVLLAGACKAIKDTLQHHFETSVFNGKTGFFGKDSWKRKYKDFDKGDLRERFFGSKTFLVWTTDGWHLFDVLYTSLFELAIALLVSKFCFPFGVVYVIALFVGLKIVHSITFNLAYHFFLIKK